LGETILERWGITAGELTELIDANPACLRGILLGYVAERKLWSKFVGRVTGLRKPDDLDRSQRCDLVVTHRATDFKIECKSVLKRGVVCCKFGDWQTTRLPSGAKIRTHCMARTDFDILAVSLFGVTGSWDYGFALSRNLPGPVRKGYSKEARSNLIATTIKVEHPLAYPFSADPFALMDQLCEEQQ
jgi:hypothetical protein